MKKLYKPNTSISELDLSVRSYNALKRVGVDTIGKLARMSEEDLYSVRNLGEKSIKETLRLLEEYQQKTVKLKDILKIMKQTKASIQDEYWGEEVRQMCEKYPVINALSSRAFMYLWLKA